MRPAGSRAPERIAQTAIGPWHGSRPETLPDSFLLVVQRRSFHLRPRHPHVHAKGAVLAGCVLNRSDAGMNQEVVTSPELLE
jgi:hypothetical protein